MDPDNPYGSELLARVTDAVELLENIHKRRGILAHVPVETRQRLLTAAGQVSRPSRNAMRAQARAMRRVGTRRRREADEAVLSQTGIRQIREQSVFPTPPTLIAPLHPELAHSSIHSPDEDEDFLTPEEAEPGTDNAEPGTDSAEPGTDSAEPGRIEAGARVENARNCYQCKRNFHEIHFFYDSMCPECAALNWQKRHQSADLSGRVALITGARVKIGYQAAIKLLRAGAHVIVSTRFPRDAAKRYAAEADFAAWQSRLQIVGLDLRHTPSVELFARTLAGSLDRLDFIINNACQTVRRPVGFYRHLMDDERLPLHELPEPVRAVLVHPLALPESRQSPQSQAAAADLLAPAGAANDSLKEAWRGSLSQAAAGLLHSAELSQVPLIDEDHHFPSGGEIFPQGALDADLQQVDLRERNSWRLTLAEVPTVELLEVHLVNAVAPFILNGALKPVMLRTDSRDKHIVNVSAMEGQFYRRFKTDKHPHTNMAKAALNMMTRTSAADYVKDGIHMNSVDTGWVTDEDPAELAARKRAVHGFHPPLDIVDGAARIVDPIFHGYATGEHHWGKFFKDYRETDW